MVGFLLLFSRKQSLNLNPQRSFAEHVNKALEITTPVIRLQKTFPLNREVVLLLQYLRPQLLKITTQHPL